MENTMSRLNGCAFHTLTTCQKRLLPCLAILFLLLGSAAHGQSAAPAKGTIAVDAYNHIAVTADRSGPVRIFDTTSATAPTLLSTYTAPSELTGVALAGESLLVSGQRGVEVLDISNSKSPVFEKLVQLDSEAVAVKAAGNLGYTAFGSTVVLFDISTGTILDKHDYSTLLVNDLAVSGDYLYVLSSDPDAETGFQIAKVQLQGSLGQPLAYWTSSSGQFGKGRMSLFAGDSLIYVGSVLTQGAGQVPGLQVLEDAGASFNVKSVPQPMDARMARSSGVGLLAFTGAADGVQGESRLGVLETAANPDLAKALDLSQVLHVLNTSGPAQAVTLYQGYAYVAAGSAGLQVIPYASTNGSKAPPSLSLSTSITAETPESGSLARLTANVTAADQVRKVDFYLNGDQVASTGGFPFEYRFFEADPDPSTAQMVSACVEDIDGNSVCSEPEDLNAKSKNALTVTSVTPLGSSHTPRSSKLAISAQFSLPLDVSTVKLQNVSLVRAATKSAPSAAIPLSSVTYQPATKSISIQPKSPLASGSYKVVLSAAIKSFTATSMVSDYAWSFDVDAATDAGVLFVNPDGLYFGTLPIGSTSSRQSIYVYNIGSEPITVTTYSTTGDFGWSSQYCIPPYTLSVGGACGPVFVTFTPTVLANPDTGSLVVSSTGGSATVSLTGAGVKATKALVLTPAGTAGVNFGTVEVGTTANSYPYSYYVSVYNAGTDPVTFSLAPAISGANAAEFSVPSNGCSGDNNPLAAGAYCNVFLQFTPSAPGNRTATLTFTDDASTGSGIQTITLAGTATSAAPAFTLLPETLAFDPAVITTTSGGQEVTFINNSTTAVTISGVTFQPSGNFVRLQNYYGDCDEGAVSPGGHCSVEVAFAPTAEGALNTTMTLTDSTGKTYVTSVYGYGTAPGRYIAVSPAGLNFAPQALLSSSGTQTVSLFNDSGTPVTVGQATGENVIVGSSTTGAFTVIADACSNINFRSDYPNNGCYLHISLTPVANTSLGTQIGTISIPITYKDSTTGTVAITLTGTVVGDNQPQTITFGALANQTYGVAPITLTATASSGLPVTYTVSGPATVSGSRLSIIGAGTVTVTASQAGNNQYAPAPTVSQSFTVAKATLTATANNQSRQYGAANPTLTYAVTGFVNGDTSSVVSGSATLTTTATSTSAVGTYPITFATENLAASNYTITYVAGTLTVSGGASQTITFGALSNQTYGVSPITLTATASSGLPVTYTVTGPATVSGSTLTITGAGSVTVTAAQAGNSNYAAAPNVSQSFTVAKATLTATANNQSRQYGAANPTLTYAVTGFVNGDTSSVVSGSATLTTTATSTSAVGTYPITFATENLAASNYTITYVAGTLTVSGGASQTITFGALSNQTYGVSPITLTATASSGLPVTYTVTGPATVSGSTLTITGAGSVTVTAAQAGNSNYAAAPNVSQSFTVAKATLTATANNQSRQYGAANPTLTYAVTGFVNGDTSSVVSGSATLTTTATSTSAVGTYPITFATENLAASNYTITYVAGTLTVTSASTVAPPSFSPQGGTYTSTQSVVLSDGTSGATIYYTTNGSTPGMGSTVYSTPIQVAATETINAIAILNGVSSTVSTATYTITTGQCTTINYANGFTSTGLTLNGGATVKNNLLQLTDGGFFEARSAFYSNVVPVTNFTTDFTFQLLYPLGDGITFTIQSNNAQEVGQAGGGLGYAGIPNSVAIKADLFDNNGEGFDSTGLYLNGAYPSTPAISLEPVGINLHSGHVFAVHIVYANDVATGAITDTVTSQSGTMSVHGDLSKVVGDKAYVGFTGGTGVLTATQNILSWSYSGGAGCAVQ